MMEQDTYLDAYKILYKQDIEGGMCSDKIDVDELAWSCLTCQLSQTKSLVLCDDCFKNGQHDGHKVKVQKGTGTQSCECGGSSFKKEGYCTFHTGQNIDDFDVNDWKMKEKAQQEIRRTVKALEHLCLQIDCLKQNYPMIVKHICLLCMLARNNNCCKLLIVRELAQISSSPHFKHFPSISKKNQCNQMIYMELINIDPWFKKIQQSPKAKGLFGEACRCLRLDNLFKISHIVPYSHAYSLIDLFTILLSSQKFEMMMSLSIARNFNYYYFSLENESLLEISCKIIREKSVHLSFLKRYFALASFQASFFSALKLFKQEQTKLSGMKLRGCLEFINALLSPNISPPLAYFNLCEIIIRFFNSSNMLFTIPYYIQYVPQNQLSFQIKLIGLFAETAQRTALCISRLDLCLQLQLYEHLQKSFITLSENYKEQNGFSLCMPTLFLISYLISHRMLPYIFARLKGNRIVIDPLFKGPLSPQFSNKVLNKMFDKEHAEKMKFILPQPWTQENLSSLRPFDLLFHYTVNSLKPIFGLQAKRKQYSYTIKFLYIFGSLGWKALSFFHFTSNIHNRKRVKLISDVIKGQASSSLPSLLNIFGCLHQAAIILSQAPFYHQHLSSIKRQNNGIAQVLKNQLNSVTKKKSYISVQTNLHNFSFNNPFGLYQSLFTFIKYKQEPTKQEFKMHEYLVSTLGKFELFKIFGGLQLTHQNQVLSTEVINRLKVALRDSFDEDCFKQYIEVNQNLEEPSQCVLVLKDQYQKGMNQSFECSQLVDFQRDRQLIFQEKSLNILGYFSTLKIYGVRNLPIFNQMRAIASGVTPTLIDSILKDIMKDYMYPKVSTFLITYLVKLYAIGIQATHRLNIPPKEEEYKVLAEIIDLYTVIDPDYGDFKEKVVNKLTDFMKDRKVKESLEEEKGFEESKSQASEEQKEGQEFKLCSICSHPCDPEGIKAFGIPCYFGTNNLISKAQIQDLKYIKKEQNEEFNVQQWEDALHHGQFYLKTSSKLVHYHCIKAKISGYQRAFKVDRSKFNCVIPLSSKYNEPSLQEYMGFQDKQKFYSNPHPAIQFIATLIEIFCSSNHPSIEKQIVKEIVFPIGVKNKLPYLPMMIAQIISDNVALVVRFRGLVTFLKECMTQCSPTLVCIQNMKKVSKFFTSNLSQYLDEAVSEPTPTSCLKYGNKFERHVANLIVWKELMDQEAQRRLKLIFSLYAQLLVEIKLHEGRCPEISRTDLLPFVEMASALVLSRYNGACLAEIVEKLDNIEGTNYFDYLWEEILGMNPLVLGVFSNKAVVSAQACGILPSKEDYIQNKQLRTLQLSHPLKFKIISFPEDFLQFQIQYYSKACNSCGEQPFKPWVCCLCGEVLCSEKCYADNQYKEPIYHSFSCDFGFGAFVDIQTAQVSFILMGLEINLFNIPHLYVSALGDYPSSNSTSSKLNLNGISLIEKKLNELEAHTF